MIIFSIGNLAIYIVPDVLFDTKLEANAKLLNLYKQSIKTEVSY